MIKEEDIFAKHKCPLKNAEMGKVVTRFPPEPSGFLHIGHAKACIVNYSYAKMFKGKMLMRFDDTNPTKEKEDFVDNILKDVKALGVKYDSLSYTSDHFPKMMELMEMLIKEGNAYTDNTPTEIMKKERTDGIESKCRSNTVEENLKHWNDMILGTEEGLKYCVRAKIDMKIKVKCLRDPVMYRCNLTPHHRTGIKYKVYPCYDFACPIVDSIEGVTHAMRTIEYRDRNALYKWVLEKTKLRIVEIQDFSRLCFVNTVLSKRKLQQFVDKGLVDGWNDPRFPTVQGIMRRGMTIPAITEFMLEQGASQNTNLMEWDKLWSINKKVIDPIAPRYSAIGKDSSCVLILENGPVTIEKTEVPLHQKNEALGKKELFFSNKIMIENADAKTLQPNEKITLYKWGNCIVTGIKEEAGKLTLTGKLVLEDKDFKSTKKITWIPCDPSLNIDCKIIEFDHLITKPSLDDTDDLDKWINPKTKIETLIHGECQMQKLKKGDIIQIERRGYYYVCLLYTSPSPRDATLSRMPSSA
eukprot:TRINITY_DN1339_c0_g2_i2.p1 TRINITY_DN1339_c0_g2~~TRINITY_DN1339_c0_g2_i2.p1  ORF type:complete len:526 (+),score=118.84 TRINITY_DN1339_c0_g2_i2:25-1602(+)